jgi:hypothetical protein
MAYSVTQVGSRGAGSIDVGVSARGQNLAVSETCRRVAPELPFIVAAGDHELVAGSSFGNLIRPSPNGCDLLRRPRATRWSVRAATPAVVSGP